MSDYETADRQGRPVELVYVDGGTYERGVVRPLKLNLGAGAHELAGFVNRGPENDGWRFQDGLGDYDDGSVEAVSISHSLYLLPIADWPFAFNEIARVLEPGGVVRITEDATDDRRSPRYGGFDGWVTLTSRGLVSVYLESVGLDVRDVSETYSYFRDFSLVQRHHGSPPKVFHVEGLKPVEAGRNEVVIEKADPVVVVHEGDLEYERSRLR